MRTHFRSFLIMMLLPVMVLAGTRGKLAGVISDRANGQPIAGANIYIEGQSLGAASDESGQFLILNILPGNYTVTVEFIGYTKQQVQNVQIAADLTTMIEVELAPHTLESEETITVLAERPLIRRDATSKMAVVDGDAINQMPVASFSDVVASQAGITTDAQGNLHFRGGRVSEVAFLIDGQPVKNPVNNSLAGLIDNYAIRELQVLSGTFNAEYGSAMSGIVNIVTNEGRQEVNAKVELTSAMLNTSPYRKTDALVSDANPIYDKQNERRLYYRETSGLDLSDPILPYQGNVSGFLSGPLPAGIGSFFFSGEYKNEDNWQPFGYDFTRSGFAKLTFPVGVNKLTVSAQLSRQENQPYFHRYKYLPENAGQWEIESKRYSAQYNHMLSARSYFIVNASLLDHQSLFAVNNLDYRDYVFPDLDEHLEFVIVGNNQSWADFKSQTMNLKFDWVYQHGRHNEFKSGFEYNQHTLDVFDYTNEGNNADEFFLNEYKKEPVTFSFYVQDKMEYETIVINAGLRADYVDVKAQAYRDITDPNSGLVNTEPEFKLSPRLGLAYPLTASTVFHFSYGHFFQFPNFQEIYRNLQFLNNDELARASLALVANPNVKSQKTTAYEFGISQKLTDQIAITVSAYSKDITDLLGTVFVQTLYRYAIFTNNDFARVQGIDFSIEKRMSNYWTAKFDYTYSVARGNEASPTEEAYNIFEGRPLSKKEFYLDFDRRHDFSLNFTLALPRDFGPQLAGIYPLERTSLSVLAQFSSGLPYTPISDDRTQYFEKNSARMPWTNSVDLRLERFFPLAGLTTSLFLEVTNLFDRQNPLVVQPRTGKLWDDGKSHLFGSGADYMHNPSHVAPPRIVRAGASVAL